MAEEKTFQEELMDFIDQEEAAELGYSPEAGYQIPDMSTANYVVKKLKEIQAEKQLIEDQAKQALEDYALKVDTFKQKTLSPLTYMEDVYKNQLILFLQNNLTGKQRSMKLVNGTIGFRKAQPQIMYDEPTLISMLEQEGLNQYLQTKTSLNKKEIRSHIKKDVDGVPMLDGKRLTGIIVEDQPDAFTIR